ncbi:MAG: hypothetical protein U0Q16_09225 [Bryobacteraceae bacterium]
MRAFVLFAVALAAAFAYRNPEARIEPLIDQFDGFVQQRLAEPLPKELGLSRVMRPSSFGRHFAPTKFAVRDFIPRDDAERKLVAELESQQVQLGMYLFGESVLRTDPAEFSYRAMKGPGIVTQGTSRLLQYAKVLPPVNAPKPDFPDWNTIYPIAREAMTAFAKGEQHYETQAGSWTIAARPAAASSARCVACHNNDPAIKRPSKFQEGDILGGAIYVYRAPAPRH